MSFQHHTPHQYYFHQCCCQSAHSNCTFFWPLQDVRLFFLFKLASQVEHPLPYTMHVKFPIFRNPSHHVITPMTTFPAEAAIPYPHFPFSFFGSLFPFYTPCCTGGLSFNPTLDTMYPCIDFKEGEWYTQLCLPWSPMNPSLWIPVPPVSLYFHDIRVTLWTYPSHRLAGILFNVCCVASHAALCYTHILIILKK